VIARKDGDKCACGPHNVRGRAPPAELSLTKFGDTCVKFTAADVRRKPQPFTHFVGANVGVR